MHRAGPSWYLPFIQLEPGVKKYARLSQHFKSFFVFPPPHSISLQCERVLITESVWCCNKLTFPTVLILCYKRRQYVPQHIKKEYQTGTNKISSGLCGAQVLCYIIWCLKRACLVHVLLCYIVWCIKRFMHCTCSAYFMMLGLCRLWSMSLFVSFVGIWIICLQMPQRSNLLYSKGNCRERNIRKTHAVAKLQKIVSANPGLKSKRGFDKHFLMA